MAIDTETREVTINHGEGCEKLKARVEQIIKDLLEVQAPVDLTRGGGCQHNHSH